MTKSIYPIPYLTFTCNGCKVEWTLRADIKGLDAFKAFMDGGKMGPCPRNCGAKACDVSFLLPKGYDV